MRFSACERLGFSASYFYQRGFGPCVSFPSFTAPTLVIQNVPHLSVFAHLFLNLSKLVLVRINIEVSHRVVKCSSNFAPNSFIFFVPQISMTRCLFRAPSHWPMKMKFGKMIERRYTSWLLEVASGSVFQNSKKSRFLWFSLPSTLKTFFATQLNRIRRFFPI